jgi:DNA-binding beta-propeller fold protein YncE
VVSPRPLLLAALACLLLGAAPSSLVPLYSAPAGDRPAGSPHPGDPFEAILPDGRIVAPVGRSIVVGTGALGLALAPGGRYALVVSVAHRFEGSFFHDDATGPVGGVSLAVVALPAMRFVEAVHPPDAAFTGGIAAVALPEEPGTSEVLVSDAAIAGIRCYRLTPRGDLVPAGVVRLGRGVRPGAIAVAPDARVAYVLDTARDRMLVVNLAERHVVATVGTGFDPASLAVGFERVVVTDEGLADDAPAVAAALPVPPFAPPAFDAERSSGLTVVDVGAGGLPLRHSAQPPVLMDPMPDGLHLVGGAHPDAVLVAPDRLYAYVTLDDDDRIAVVSMSGVVRVVGGLDLRLYVGAPYGTQPTALAEDGRTKRLYVALSGLDAVAVLDARRPRSLHRLGLIPAGARPDALALSPDGRYLYVLSADGYGAGWSSLQRIDTHRLPLMRATLSALRYTRTVRPVAADRVIPPFRDHARSDAVRHVVWIVVGAVRREDVLDDAEPNAAHLQELAERYAIADNFYLDEGGGDLARAMLLDGIVTPFLYDRAQRDGAQQPLGADDPNAYPREGSIFNQLAAAGLDFRDYGGGLDLRDRMPDGTYAADTPLSPVLRGHMDEAYRPYVPGVGDAALADEFIRDFSEYVRRDGMPAFTYLWLPAERDRSVAAALADADAAVGRAVAAVHALPQWDRTAVFIVPDDLPPSRTSESPMRAFALVVSPAAKHGYRSAVHLSLASVVKTTEELLGLPPIALPELIATDMSSFFAPQQAARGDARTEGRR